MGFACPQLYLIVHRSFANFVMSMGAGNFHADMIDSYGELAIQCIHQLRGLWDALKYGSHRMLTQLPYAVSQNNYPPKNYPAYTLHLLQSVLTCLHIHCVKRQRWVMGKVVGWCK